MVNQFGPAVHEVRVQSGPDRNWGSKEAQVGARDWRTVKETVRSFIFDNFNPGLLPNDNAFRNDIFDRISSISGLLLALEPQVLVGKIRARIFRTWSSRGLLCQLAARSQKWPCWSGRR